MFNTDEVRGVMLKLLPYLSEYYQSVGLPEQFSGEAILTTIGDVRLAEGGRQTYWVAAFVLADDPDCATELRSKVREALGDTSID